MEIVFVLVFIVVVAAVVYGFYAAAQRRKMLIAWAARHGLSFHKAKDRDFDSRFPGIKCLNKGHSRYACNVMRGHWGERPIIAFDYHYTTGSGKNQSNYNFSAVIIESPFVLKPLHIRREGFFDKVTEFLGFDDIDFESAEFSRNFYVTAADKRWAYDIIHQRMMEYLMAAPEFAVQFDVLHIITWNDKEFDPADFEAAANHIRNILDLVPDYVVQQSAAMG